MGARAYLLVNVSEDTEQADFINILRELEEMSGIDFVDPVVGSRDLVIMVDTPLTIEAIASQIQAKKGVQDLEILRIVSASERHRAVTPESLKDTKPRCTQVKDAMNDAVSKGRWLQRPPSHDVNE